MKLGQKPGKIWHEASELQNKFSRINSQINRLILLENIWEKTLGSKAKFWVLDAVKGGTIYVKVKVTAARHELLLKEKIIVKELNKHFDKPWIKQISIV
ncbi:MAG: DUF721 domain-containing protein [Elusimicrobiota bacterium]|jgi:hypothetical protein|nr:DUF721 domain-containing protein [Elusimicrobiota bacterium]